MRVVITVPCAPIQSPRSRRLDLGEQIVADDGLGNEELEVGAAVGDGEEHELAGVALEHQATADRDGDVGLLARPEFGAEGAHVGGAVRAVVAVGIGLLTGSPQIVDLSLTTGALGLQATAGDRGGGFLVGLDHVARRYRS